MFRNVRKKLHHRLSLIVIQRFLETSSSEPFKFITPLTDEFYYEKLLQTNVGGLFESELALVREQEEYKTWFQNTSAYQFGVERIDEILTSLRSYGGTQEKLYDTYTKYEVDVANRLIDIGRGGKTTGKFDELTIEDYQKYRNEMLEIDKLLDKEVFNKRSKTVEFAYGAISKNAQEELRNMSDMLLYLDSLRAGRGREMIGDTLRDDTEVGILVYMLKNGYKTTKINALFGIGMNAYERKKMNEVIRGEKI
jgi:hypothetical protein